MSPRRRSRSRGVGAAPSWIWQQGKLSLWPTATRAWRTPPSATSECGPRSLWMPCPPLPEDAFIEEVEFTVGQLKGLVEGLAREAGIEPETGRAEGGAVS